MFDHGNSENVDFDLHNKHRVTLAIVVRGE
jgi:hypothetical protein